MSFADVQAILTALPIVENFPADSPIQKSVNHLCCQGARQKLLSGRKDFTQNELRVIAASVCYAAEYLAGRMPELAALHPNISEVQQFALSYVRLSGYFLPQIPQDSGNPERKECPDP